MRVWNLAFLAVAMLVLTPVLAVAQQEVAPATPAPAAQAPAAPAPDAQAPAAPEAGKGQIKGMKNKAKAKMHAAGKCPCPYCPMKDDKATDTKDVHGKQMRMMMNARIGKNDPGVLLGMREDLKLTPEQAQQLEQLQAQNRQQVESILTDEQKTQLAQVPAEASSMHDMHQQMASKMDGAAAGEADPGAIDRTDEETAAREKAAKELMNK